MPPVETDADRASFFDASEFGQVAEIRGKPVEGYLDESTEQLDDLGPVGVLTTNPSFQCRTVDLPADLEDGEPITITRDDGSMFSGKMVTTEPDGFGLSLVRLEDSNG